MFNNRHICNLLNVKRLVHLHTNNDAPPNSLMDSIVGPNGENSPKIKSWSMFPNLQHFGGRGACWSFGMGIKKSDKKINYSHGPTQTKQQVY